jgi:large subunit ribosomal protein L21
MEQTVYAIIEDSGSQMKVSAGDVVEIDLRERPEGDTLVFDRVLAIGDCDSDKAARVGRPYLEGASVSAEVIEEFRGKKLHVQKYKRRKGYRRKIGHRQGALRVKIASIDG